MAGTSSPASQNPGVYPATPDIDDVPEEERKAVARQVADKIIATLKDTDELTRTCGVQRANDEVGRWTVRVYMGTADRLPGSRPRLPLRCSR